MKKKIVYFFLGSLGGLETKEVVPWRQMVDLEGGTVGQFGNLR
jgi:hypothetical protein